jgi:hypothetical protein
LGAIVIYDLTKDLEEKQHYVYFDSYFTHVAFMKALKDKRNSYLWHRGKGKSRNDKKFCGCKSYEKRQL